MEEVLVATPLPHSSSAEPRTFTGGISVQAISPILWDLSVLKTYIAEHDREKLDQTRYWLCASREAKPDLTDVQDLYETVHQAMYACQIIHPSGSDNIYLAFHRKPEGYDHVGTFSPPNMNSTLIGRITTAERRGLAEDFDLVYSGVRRAFVDKIVRLQNPILLLEQGLQIGTSNLAMLMFVMGLDMLFMAGQREPFIKRVAGFFGKDSYIFPTVLSQNYQPDIAASEVVGDLYDFRNIIAHGQEIPEHPYRQTYAGSRIAGPAGNFVGYSYADVLRESALFLLTGALGKIFKGNLYDQVRDVAKWRISMTCYEHRFKDSGGVASPSPHKDR